MTPGRFNRKFNNINKLNYSKCLVLKWVISTQLFRQIAENNKVTANFAPSVWSPAARSPFSPPFRRVVAPGVEKLREVRRLPNGDREVTLHYPNTVIASGDPAIDLDAMGSDAFEKAYPFLRAQPLLLARVRSRFGPLWARTSPGTGTDFRFVMPGGSSSTPVIARYLAEGFRVPSLSMPLAIELLFEEAIPFRNSITDRSPSRMGSSERRDRYLSGTLSFPRWKFLLRLLQASVGRKEMVAVDNGPGFYIDIAMVAAELGINTYLKEIDPIRVQSLMGEHWPLLPPSLQARIQIVPPDVIDEVTPADLSYWVHPMVELPRDASLFEYLARDVRPGGYLVVQTDMSEYRFGVEAGWDSMMYLRLYGHGIDGAPNFLFPSVHERSPDTRLILYRRNKVA